ncbi:MAG TPA: maltose alpha-D-glucosyltransferase [Candidatus Binatia bacterium]|nr:maltose alpha-D-glucosyltransferase [Candidatus Binatia bacterium]
MRTVPPKTEVELLDNNPLWYKDAVIYELHVRAFADGNSDGIGDFKGLTGKLDYLQDLGVTALWLLPFYPSPLKDDGYDISDYTNIHPDYGTLQDFRAFLKEAHRRSLRVITELILNHTSDQHPWFQEARRAKPGSRKRDFYVWSDVPEKYKEARIIFKDFEHSNWTWDSLAKAYYWHRFYSHQPDLNFDSPDVRGAVMKVLDFWLKMGVDGMRLDAVPYLYEREGTNCENLPEVHSFLKELRQYIDKKYKNRMLLAEANQWPEDAAAYFGRGDECHMAFHFPLMPRLFMATRMEDRFPIIDILDQTPHIPEASQWALFLRNHDELTLEMVTDEDRDYMYKVYASDPQARVNLGIRRRLAPLLGNNRRKIEILNCLLFSMPGTPVIYYGDEIGMGDNIYLGDRNGVRTPMQWSADRNAGFSRANPQRLYLPIIIDPEYHYEAMNVEAQQQNPHSLLWWMKRLITLRKRYQAFGQGSIEFLSPDNRKILVFTRRFQQELILVVANLSRFVQFAELDLSAFKGMIPVELFGQTDFPRIGDLPYFVTMGPHAFYWFKLDSPKAVEVSLAAEPQVQTLQVMGAWDAVLGSREKSALEKILPDYLRSCRWFGGKAKRLRSVNIVETIPIPLPNSRAYILFLQTNYVEGEAETYILPITFVSGERASQLQADSPQAVIARISQKGDPQTAVLYDALYEKSFCDVLLRSIARNRRFTGTSGEMVSLPTGVFRRLRGPEQDGLEPSIVKREQSNTSIFYGDRLILKLFRRTEEGVNPDIEIGRFLTEKVSFSHVPPVAGALEYRKARNGTMALGVLQGLVPNQGDAWQYTLDEMSRFFERALAVSPELQAVPFPQKSLLDLTQEEFPSVAQETISSYLEAARKMGQRTGELHVALASSADDPDFAPEPFSMLYQRSLYQSMRSLTTSVFQLLRKRIKALPDGVKPSAQRVLDLEQQIHSRFQLIRDRRITAMRMRIHGDHHLGQILYTGKDFVIIDFEGEPARSLTERRRKRSPLQDVAGMIRSFHYAAYAALLGRAGSAMVRPENLSALEPWARFWFLWVSVAYLRAYLEVAAQQSFLPKSREEQKILLDACILEKAVYELGYELNNRPNWINVPIMGILEIVQ